MSGQRATRRACWALVAAALVDDTDARETVLAEITELETALDVAHGLAALLAKALGPQDQALTEVRRVLLGLAHQDDTR